MKTLKTFEEYKFMKIAPEPGNVKDSEEPFFNKDKPAYFKEKIKKDIEDKKKRAILTGTESIIRISHYSDIDNVKDAISKKLENSKEVIVQVQDGVYDDVIKKIIKDLKLEITDAPVYPDKPWYYVKLKKKYQQELDFGDE